MEREYHKAKPEEMKILREILNLKDSKCSSCGCEIKEDDKYSIFSIPTRIICSSILCLATEMEKDE